MVCHFFSTTQSTNSNIALTEIHNRTVRSISNTSQASTSKRVEKWSEWEMKSKKKKTNREKEKKRAKGWIQTQNVVSIMHLYFSAFNHSAIELVSCAFGVGGIGKCYETKSLHAKLTRGLWTHWLRGVSCIHCGSQGKDRKNRDCFFFSFFYIFEIECSFAYRHISLFRSTKSSNGIVDIHSYIHW